MAPDEAPKKAFIDGHPPDKGASRRPPDYSSNLCPPRTLLDDFLGAVLGLLCKEQQQEGGPKHPEKSHIANVLGGHRLDE